jgi:hypothetical protein
MKAMSWSLSFLLTVTLCASRRRWRHWATTCGAISRRTLLPTASLSGGMWRFSLAQRGTDWCCMRAAQYTCRLLRHVTQWPGCASVLSGETFAQVLRAGVPPELESAEQSVRVTFAMAVLDILTYLCVCMASPAASDEYAQETGWSSHPSQGPMHWLLRLLLMALNVMAHGAFPQLSSLCLLAASKSYSEKHTALRRLQSTVLHVQVRWNMHR